MIEEFPLDLSHLIAVSPHRCVEEKISFPLHQCDTSFHQYTTEPLSEDSVVIRTEKRSFGTWVFNPRKRRRVYISLTGAKLHGSKAISQARLDKESEQHPSRSARSLLGQLMSNNPCDLDDCASLKYLAQWGFPPDVLQRYAERQITSLFSWQVDCLRIDNGAVLRGGNLVYTAPTSGGKTLVSEILMLRRLGLACRGEKYRGTIMYVVPFISLADEKATYLQEMWCDMLIGVKSYTHSEESTCDELTDDVDIAICTIEKANILFSALCERHEEKRLSMVVVDELHLLGDSQRGYLLEVLLSKIRFILGDTCQIIGMSATLPNTDVLGTWLRASVYTTVFRPVDLDVLVCCNRHLYRCVESISFNNKDAFEAHRAVMAIDGNEDSDGMLGLSLEILLERKSLMIFCPTKRNCEVTAEKIVCKLLQPLIANETMITLNDDFRKYFTHRSHIRQQLKETPVGLCSILRKTISYGIAYHHAGLTIDERKIIEQGYRDGAISVLCTTSTLAAGVNLPAQRVIIRSTKMGPSDLSVAAFRQMCGRAGRLNLDNKGEAVLLLSSTAVQRQLAHRLMTSPLPPLESALQKSDGGLSKLVLDSIHSCRVKTRNDAATLMHCTLLNTQSNNGEEVLTRMQDSLQLLLQNQFIIHARNCTEQAASFHSSPLGRATSLSGLSPLDAVVVLESLSSARKRLILKGGLHAVFLITPPSPACEPNWSMYESIYELLSRELPDVAQVADHLGVSFGDICAYKYRPPKYGCNKPKSCLYRRFYASLLLYNIINETPLNKVATAVDMQRGQLQQLQKDSAAFCGMVVQFCRKLNWHALACVLEGYSSRLAFGVRQELVPLVRLGTDIMPPFRARALFRSGITSPLDVVNADTRKLHAILMDALPFDSDDPLLAATTGINEAELQPARRKHDICTDLVNRIVFSAEKHIEQEMVEMSS